MNTTAKYRIDATPKGKGPHWAHMRDPNDHLQQELGAMAAVLRISRGEGSDEDYESTELSRDQDPMEAAFEYVNSFALEAKRAVAEDGFGRTLFVLGAGGPHVELDILTSPYGVEKLILHRHWTQVDYAWTTDSRACEVAGEFLELIYPE